MAWMLFENLMVSAVAFVIGVLVKGIWRCLMSEKCMINGCFRLCSASSHGLCLVCYGRAKKKVEAGEVTWQKLAELGLCKHQSDNPFDDAYTRAMEDQ